MLNEIPVIKPKNLQKIIQVSENPPDFNDVLKSIKTHENLRPDSFAIDPRNGNLMIYCVSRKKRPKNREGESLCSICQKEIPPVVLARRLPSGNYAFVTENQFSFLNPDMTIDHFFKRYGYLTGINFLLWPTTEHKEIHEISYEDNAVSFEVMAEIEKLIKTTTSVPVQFIKNTASSKPRPMHSQYHVADLRIVSSDTNHHKRSVWTRSKVDNEDEKYTRKNEGISYTEFVRDLYENTFPGLKIKDYGEMVLAIHPHMKRPLEAIIYPKSQVQDVSHLNKEQRLALAKATSDVSYALSLMMPAMGFSINFSLLFHNLGKVMYVEALPLSQYPGGFERKREYVCESNHAHSAEIYKRFFEQYVETKKPEERETHSKIISDIKRKILAKTDRKYASKSL